MLRFFGIALLSAICCLAQDEKPAPTIPELETTAQGLYMHADYEGAGRAVHDVLVRQLDELRKLKPERLVRRRREKFLRIGEYLD